jgi:hypothetical protein
MLTIAAILVGLWLFGLIASYTLGGMIHLLLVAALILAVVGIIKESDNNTAGAMQ